VLSILTVCCKPRDPRATASESSFLRQCRSARIRAGGGGAVAWVRVLATVRGRVSGPTARPVLPRKRGISWCRGVSRGGAQGVTVGRKARFITVVVSAERALLLYVQEMSTRAHKLIEEFNSLPEEEQCEVLEAIVPADLDEFEPEYRAEIERRLRSIEDGTAVLLDGDEVLARVRAKLSTR